MNPIQTVKKCILSDTKVLRMSFTIEGIYFIFMEENSKKKCLWNGSNLTEANINFQMYKDEINK